MISLIDAIDQALKGPSEPHTHPWALLLAPLEPMGQAYELDRLELPCTPTDAAPGLLAVIAGLRELADQLEAGHADILTAPQYDQDPNGVNG